MKKILFVNMGTYLGGTEKTLLNLIKFLKKENPDYEITVACIDTDGILREEFEKICRLKLIVMPEKSRLELLRGGIKKSIKCNLKKNPFKSLIMALRAMLGKALPVLSNRELKLISKEEEYDIAVAYSMHVQFNVVYVDKYVKSKKKYVWIHNDFLQTGFKVKPLKKHLENYNQVIAVSNALADEFKAILPVFKEKTSVVHNILPFDEIKALALEPADWGDDYSGNRMLTVGRLCHQKGYDLAIETAAILKEKCIDFRWYCLGDGELREKLIKYAEDKGLKDDFIFLGNKQNPYPYYQNCTLYVQSSRHEGFVTTVSEAKFLGKYIVATNFTAISEQITSEYEGIITEFNSNLLAEGIHKALNYSVTTKDNSIKCYNDCTEIAKLF